MNELISIHTAVHQAGSGMFAYIDPGTGSFVFQMLIAGALGMLATLRRVRTAVQTALQSLSRRKASASESELKISSVGNQKS